ncbi:MAG TPA: glycosyltransferase family 29 protein [Gammaproteobacteria bacterium]|nr:glycosyltransferase family 29 protein [Gammaproteobacteria bacterium]
MTLGAQWRFLSRALGERDARCCPRSGSGMPTAVLRWLARRRRARGFYDALTLWLFREVYRRRRSVVALYEYLLFRRDLGYPVGRRWSSALTHAVPRLRGSLRRLALAMLAESAAAEQPAGAGLPDGHDAVLVDGADAADFGRRSVIAIQKCQQSWRDQFAAVIRQYPDAGICVVGNAGILQGCGLGSEIDGHGLVVRFNRFRSERTSAADTGVRTDIWVRAPDFPGAAPVEADWIIVSGPDMRYRMRHWQNVRDPQRPDVPVLTVPLPVWRSLVAPLDAPPSAGLLVLAWLRQLLGDWTGISAAGFGSAFVGQPYHHALPEQAPGRRHNWGAESSLLCQWQEEGLRLLGRG